MATAAVILVVALGGSGCGLLGGQTPPETDPVGNGGPRVRPGGDGPGGSLPGTGAARVAVLRCTMTSFVLPVGRWDRDAVLRDAVDEDFGGVRQKTLLRKNGLRLGVLREDARARVEARLRELSTADPVTAEGLAPLRGGAVAMPLRSVRRRRSHLFLYGLEGGPIVREIGPWEAGLFLGGTVPPTEPDRLDIAGGVVLDAAAPGSDPRAGLNAERFRDLTPSELIKLLPGRGDESSGLPAEESGIRESPAELRMRGRTRSGAVLMLWAAADAAEAPVAGGMLLTDGPPDVGVETVLLIRIEVPSVRAAGDGGEVPESAGGTGPEVPPADRR